MNVSAVFRNLLPRFTIYADKNHVLLNGEAIGLVMAFHEGERVHGWNELRTERPTYRGYFLCFTNEHMRRVQLVAEHLLVLLPPPWDLLYVLVDNHKPRCNIWRLVPCRTDGYLRRRFSMFIRL
jgi:hypothetical protein